MFKCSMCLFLTIFSFSLFSNSPDFAHVIDYGKYASGQDPAGWDAGYHAFNGAPELFSFFVALKQKYKISTVVETGTFHGSSTTAFSLIFDRVHTIEIVDSTFIQSKERLERFSNVQCHLGSSEVVLNQILPDLKDERAMFYLDAHWQERWPLLAELDEISVTHKDNCVIVIDDFKVPGRPDIPYDRYGKDECTIEYVRKSLDKIFSQYTYHYLIPKSVQSRAKLVVIPKNWR